MERAVRYSVTCKSCIQDFTVRTYNVFKVLKWNYFRQMTKGSNEMINGTEEGKKFCWKVSANKCSRLKSKWNVKEERSNVETNGNTNRVNVLCYFRLDWGFHITWLKIQMNLMTVVVDIDSPLLLLRPIIYSTYNECHV